MFLKQVCLNFEVYEIFSSNHFVFLIYMPQHKSSVKRVRQDAKRRIHNRALRSKMRTLVKNVLKSTDKTTAETNLKSAVSYLDRMAVKGIVHKNNAANKKSTLVRYVNGLQ